MARPKKIVDQPPIETLQTKTDIAVKDLSLEETMRECASILADIPTALEFTVFVEKGVSKRDFIDRTVKAVEAREELRDLIVDIYGRSALNYGTIASKLRVTNEAVMALCDEQFQESSEKQI